MYGLRSDDSRAKIATPHRSQAVVEFALDGAILTANTTFREVMGYGLNEVRGRHHGLFVDPAEREAPAYRAFWDGLRAGAHRSAELRHVAKGGREIWIQATYNPVLDRGGRVVKFATDITVQARERLRRIEAQRAIGTESDAIGAAVEDATQQTIDVSGTVGWVSGDIQAVAAGAKELSASVGRSTSR